ncbi:methionyl-tRNA formyltransferase [Nesterenkonia sp. E16_7]|uniref:methionyl-tRNA formyltransferase n=1 Tax=unclassified Nesterenkonia TaxID=2629769 RepID=UPI001A912056|nr:MULTISPECIES: methionyl-tRNA formyltransferase [unclassified Nesterenkonia]MBO0595123.1 methionyl-tRNA formyltransferase [Nesterenkonia sp. E16_10]MBO0598779.1 methionyl-tRNA formyltransferase [Nesterenkonia sp. E16_7]
MQQFTEDTLAAARAETRGTGPGPGRIIFAGTPEIAATALRTLLGSGAEVAAVLTRPDAPVGRRRKLTPSPVAQVAEEAGIPVIKADRVDAEVTAELTGLEATLGVVVAYGALLPTPALEAPARGWVNLHYSQLPLHRGAAPVPHTMLAGATETAATVFQLERGMDTGPIHGTCSYQIAEASSAGTVLEELTALGASLLVVLLPDLLAGRSTAQEQVGDPSYAPKLTSEDAFIDPRHPAAELVHRINATIPEPGAWTLSGDQRIKLGVARLYRPEPPADSTSDQLRASDPALPETRVEVGAVRQLDPEHPGAGPLIGFRAGDGADVVLTSVQPSGKQMLNAADWYRGLQETVLLGGPEHQRPEQVPHESTRAHPAPTEAAAPAAAPGTPSTPPTPMEDRTR